MIIMADTSQAASYFSAMYSDMLMLSIAKLTASHCTIRFGRSGKHTVALAQLSSVSELWSHSLHREHLIEE